MRLFIVLGFMLVSLSALSAEKKKREVSSVTPWQNVSKALKVTLDKTMGTRKLKFKKPQFKKEVLIEAHEYRVMNYSFGN